MPRTPSVGRWEKGSPSRRKEVSRSPVARRSGSVVREKNAVGDKTIMVVARVRPVPEGSKDEVAVSTKDATVYVAPSVKDAHQGNYFTFDQAYSCIQNTPGVPYATQEIIYRDIGLPTVASSMKGYNCTIFAYGQTGSGKSYSMFGCEQLPSKRSSTPSRKAKPPKLTKTHSSSGIIPRLITDLYSQIDSRPDTRFTVEVSFYQIYLEKVTCLLNPKKGVLKVREHPLTGPYVEDLTNCLCDTKESCLKVLEEGNKSRRVGTTKQNMVSSRSHAVISINVTHQTKANGNTTTVSKLSLVDLAGSERVSKSGSSGMGVIEATTINQSLSILGKIISVLGSKSYKASQTTYVPYRDSVLTWLLRESLGGNSRTVMLATISPCLSDREETLSTLRYADQAKKIVNKAVVNEGSPRRIIHQLKCEIKFLEEQLYKGADVVLQQKLVQSQKLMEAMSKTWDERWNDTQALLREKEAETRTLQEEKIHMGREIKRLAEELKKANRQKQSVIETAKQEAELAKIEYRKLQNEYSEKCEELVNLTSKTSFIGYHGSSNSSIMSTPPITPRDPLLKEIRDAAHNLQETFRSGFRGTSPRPTSRPTGAGRGPSPLPRRPPVSPATAYRPPLHPSRSSSGSSYDSSTSGSETETDTETESEASSEAPYTYKAQRPPLPVAPLPLQRDERVEEHKPTVFKQQPVEHKPEYRPAKLVPEYKPVAEYSLFSDRLTADYRPGDRREVENRVDETREPRGRERERGGGEERELSRERVVAASFFDKPRPGSPLIAVRQPSPGQRRPLKQTMEEDERWKRWLETRKGEKGRPSTPLPVDRRDTQGNGLLRTGQHQQPAVNGNERPPPVIKHTRQPSPHTLGRREEKAHVDPLEPSRRGRERDRDSTSSDDLIPDNEELQVETENNTREAVRLSEIARKRIDTDYRRQKMGLAPLHRTQPTTRSAASNLTVRFNTELEFI